MIIHCMNIRSMCTGNNKIVPLRIGFLCSGNGGLFQKVIKACETGLLQSRIVVCVTDRLCPSQEIAESSGIMTQLVERKAYDSRETFSNDILKVLERQRIDLAILTFDSLLSGPILEKYWGRMVNVHLSLLPAFPGFKAVKKTIRSGVRFGGSTLHLIDESIDGGPILMQGIIPLSAHQNEEDYREKLFTITASELVQLIRWYEEGRVVIGNTGSPYIENGRYETVPFCPNLELPSLVKEVGL